MVIQVRAMDAGKIGIVRRRRQIKADNSGADGAFKTADMRTP